MKLVDLTEEELKLIHSEKDLLYHQMIKGMSEEELKEFDRYTPLCFPHFNRIQRLWMAEERYLEGIELGHEPNELEFIDHLESHRTPLKFHTYYCLKYPEFIQDSSNLR